MKLSSDHVMNTTEDEGRCDAMGYDAMGYEAMGYEAMGYEAMGYEAMGYEAMGYEAMDMHLVNRSVGSEAPFCGADASDNEWMGVDYYLEDRVHGPSVRNVCQKCKALAMPLVVEIIESAIEEHEAEGRFDVAEDYWELGKRLAGETGQDSLAG